MKEATQKPIRWQDWTIVGMRLVFIISITLTIVLWRNLQGTEDVYQGLPLITGIALTITVAIGICAYIRQLDVMFPFVVVLGDWIIAGIYVDFVDLDPLMTLGIIIALIVTSLLRLGPIWGSFHASGVVVITLVLIIYRLEIDPENLDLLTDEYALPGAILAVIGFSTFAWVIARQRYDYSNKIALDQLVKARADELAEMRERASTIAEMSDALTGTLNFKKILNAALDIGSLSINKRARHRIVSIVMLFRDNDTLYIADYRGLNFIEAKTFKGKAGILEEALREAVPVIGKDPNRDPELREVGMAGIRSMLVIPLRAHFDNFGILIFGADAPNVFKEDHMHTLNAIAIQATIALQNAVLYRSLMEEKERIIQMEEDARKALVRDLHDIPTQTVAAVAMRLRIIQRMMERGDDDVPNELKLVEEMSLRATEEIRHVLFKLRPLALESQGLGAALDQLAEKLKKTYKQNVVVKIQAKVEDALDETKQGALFYLIEEAVNNARKYAEAELIAVQIVRQKNILAVRIADNGKGFDMEAINASYDNRGSFGMVNMRERAELLDGTLNLKSAPGQGTTITVLIPIDGTKVADIDSGYDDMPLAATKLASSAKTRMEKVR